MRIGVLGSGRMGGKLGTIFARAGHQVVFRVVRGAQVAAMLLSPDQGEIVFFHAPLLRNSFRERRVVRPGQL